MEQEYSEIDLFDLLLSVVRKWKIIVIAMVVMALLGTGLGFFTARQAETPATEADLIALEVQMTEEEISEVKSAVSIIEEYRTMYDSQKEYNTNSIYQNLDPFDVKTATLTYYVDNNYTVSYPVISENNNIIPIVQTYLSIIREDELYERMSKEIDESISPLYFAEMVSTSTDIQDTGVFVIKVVADTNERLEKMTAIIKEELNNATASIEEIYSTHTLTLASESIQSESNSNIYNQQQANIQKLTSITQSILETEETFEGVQLSYLKAIIHEELDEDVNIALYAIIGALVGVILVAFVQVIKYLTSGTIKTEKEIENKYGLEILGVINDNNKDIDIINTKLDILSKKLSINEICVVLGDNATNENIDLIKVEGVNVIKVSDIVNNVESLRTMSEASSLVIVEKIKVSKASDLSYIIDHAKLYEVPILGVVVLE